MKRVILFLLIFGILISSGTPVLADMEDVLKNHWSKDMIDKDFLLYYFPYLAKENFKRFQPNETVFEDEFLLSFSSLLKENGYSNASVGLKTTLNRSKMAKIVGEKLMSIGLVKSTNETSYFTDIGYIPTEEQKAINALYHSGLIHGERDTIYNPSRNVTQAEAIIVLQRVSSVLEKASSIPFRLLGIVQTYSGNEGINTKTEGEKVLVTITKTFPTPGYSMEVKEIVKSKEEYKVNLNIIPPDPESELPQVITFKTITIEINKEYLGDPPYNFVLEGFL